MDRNRDARRGTMAAGNGLSRRRHRNNSLRDSPEDDGPTELETSRLRDRGSGKKDRDRERDRDRIMSRNKRRRGGAERLMHGSNREDGEDSSEESVNDEDEDEYDDGGGGGGGSVRMLPPNPPTTSLSSSSSLLNHRKSFPPVVNNKQFRPLPALKVTDEMMGVSVPRKARSVSTKRSHEWPSSCGVVGEQFHLQASTSPVRPSTSSMAAPSPAPTSPSSSHASIRKKPKLNGPKLRPPKMSTTKSSPSAQDEIEIEIAEVLYGMMRQPQGPTKQEITATDSVKFESRDKSSSDAKSRVSSPISNSPCAPPQLIPQNSSSSATSISVTAPKRKRPRPQVKYDEEHPSILPAQSSAISSSNKVATDQSMKIESCSQNLEKNSGSTAENGGFSYNLSNSHPISAPPEAQPESLKESMKPESKAIPDSKPGNTESQNQNLKPRKEEAQSPKKESSVFRLDDNREDIKTTIKANSTISEIANHREEKFQIDLMAPPPPLRSSPERDGEVDFVSVDPKATVSVAETELKPVTREDDNKALKFEPANVETENKSTKAAAAVLEESEFKKPGKERNIDLTLDLEKSDRDTGNAGFSGSKVPQHGAKQQQSNEKTVQPSSVPLPMSVPAGWPGGLSPMGYMAPLQGVVSVDGCTVPPAAMQPPQVLFNQPRPKRCATHYYIARNIYYHQQMSKMNPFWPVAAAGSGSLYGAKHCNPNVIPPEFHGSISGRGASSVADKGQALAMFPAQPGKEKASPAANLMDAAQRKQIVIQQALPPAAPSNMLHGPAFIFPLSQQQAAAAASVRPGSVNSPNAGSAALPSTVNSASMTAAATPAVAPAMSFNYPGNEHQYLAILQNNAYPFPIPAHVGAPPAYRGPHAQTLPYFNGSFYSSQMMHPSQLQQHQQQQPPSQSQQSQQGHQNPSISSGSSSSQKHLQNQQQRPSSGVNGGNGGLQGFPASKNQSSQTLQLLQQQHQQQQQQQHQRQNQQNPHAPHQARQLEHEMGGEDSPSTADSRISRPNLNIYAQNFAMPMHPQNFALMTPPMGSAGGATAASGSEKKQQQGLKAGVEASQAYAMSFASLNGANPPIGLDMASLAQSHVILQSLPEVVSRQGYQQIVAATVQAQAQAAQHKNFRHLEEGKSGGGDSSNAEEERKAMAGKASTVGHSIAFSTDGSVSMIPGNNVLDSSAAQNLNLSSAPVQSSSSVRPAAVSSVNALTPQQQYQQQMRNHQQQQQQQQHMQHQQQQILHQQNQMLQLQKQQLQQNSARSKTPATSNGSVYSDHLPSTSSMAAKFPNALSSFPHNLVQSSTSPSQSPQWKTSARTSTSQVSASSLASSTSSSLKNHPQKQARPQQSHTQISFAANPKSSTQNQGLQPASNNQSSSPPIMVGSPTTTTSSMSKGAGGSPRPNTSNSTGNKAQGQASSLSSQQVKNSPMVPSQKSSPVGGRNVPSSLGNSHITSSSTGTKSQLTQQQHQHQQQHLHQQQQQQQFSKQSIQQAQLYFSNAYMPAQQAQHSNSTGGTASPSSGYYQVSKRRRGDVQQQSQHSQGSSGTSSSGMLSLCPPVTHANNTGMTDPAKAVAAAAANNMKGTGLSSQTLMHHAQYAVAQSSGPHQHVPTGFPYVHPVPAVVQMKPAEQKKQPAGE